MHVKNIPIIIFVCILSVCNINYIHAQNTVTDIADLNTVLAKRFKLQTFQLQQFVDRFNFDEPMQVDKMIPDRKVNLFLLINQEDTALLHQAVTIGFVDTFSTAIHKINLAASNWHADVYTQFLYKNKPIEIILSLKLNGTEKKGYAWEIIKVRSGLFELPADNNHKEMFINPQNNEIMFSELSKFFLADTIDIMNVYEQPFSYSSLSSFRDYVRNKEIVFSHITKMQYVFTNIAGYDFTVENFIRTKLNAGLLISSIVKNK